MSRIKMRDAGYKLRKEILLAKKAENDECMRGTIYQLLNALSVRNEGKFMDIVIRLYSSREVIQIVRIVNQKIRNSHRMKVGRKIK